VVHRSPDSRYLIADYDRRNFSVFPCKWDANASQSIVPIHPPQTTNTIVASPPNPTPSSSPSFLGISLGAIIGIALAAFFLLLLAALTCHLLVLRPWRQRKTAAISQQQSQPPDPLLTIKPELDALESARALHEVDGQAKTETHKAELEGKAAGVETEKRQAEVYEMPAKEEVAAEMGQGMSAESEGSGVRQAKMVPGEKLEPENYQNSKDAT
jgi:hypothetical protein